MMKMMPAHLHKPKSRRITGRAAAATASVVAAAVLSLVAGGCDRPTDDPPPPDPTQTAKKNQPWQTIPGIDESVVSVPFEPDDPDIQAAIAEARKTAEDARKRWTAANAHDRTQWAIKWAAPTADNKVEHVWVIPINWSPFRIEGVLQSEPLAPLACGNTSGQIVSFPIEELTDWMHVLKVDPTTGAMTSEGGFTNKVLESRYGKP